MKLNIRRFLTVIFSMLAIVILITAGIMAFSDKPKGKEVIVDVQNNAPAAKQTEEANTPVFLVITPTPNPTPEATVEPTVPINVSNIDPTKPMVALSFDDGPSKNTTTILDILEQYNARATFFIVGDMAKGHEEILKREHALGCVIGNHTQDHKLKLMGATREQILSELDPVDELIEQITGEKALVVRPPWGSVDDAAKSVINRPIILWSVDTLDWKTRNTDSIVTEVKNSTFDGAILLMHDLYATTAEAVRIIVPWLQEQGYQLVTVPEMFAVRGIEFVPGGVYRFAKPQEKTPEATSEAIIEG